MMSLGLVLTCNAVRATESELVRLRDSDQRVASVGFRLVTSNTAVCKRLNPATGLILHSLEQYRGASKDQAMALWTFPSPVTIAGIVPGSPADLAGLRVGDGIAAIAGFEVPSVPSPGSHATALRDATEAYLQSQIATAPFRVRIKRGDQMLSTLVTPKPACRTRIEVVAGNAVKARSDGSIIQVGQGFVEQLNDDELAFVLAHELAHTIREHRRQLEQAQNHQDADRKRYLGNLARQFEDEADILALDLLVNAGWDPAIAPRFMRTTGRKFTPLYNLNGAHRNASARARQMEHALAETRGKSKEN